MVPRLVCSYIVIVILYSGILLIPQIHQATAENEDQIRDLFKSNMTRNDFSNLLQSLIKLNEHRINVLKKLYSLDDYGMLKAFLRSRDENPSKNTDLKNLYLFILSNNQSNSSRRNTGIQEVEPLRSFVAANKLQKRSIDSKLAPDSNPTRESPDIALQKPLNLTKKAKIKLRTKNVYEIDDESHSFPTFKPPHNLRNKLTDTKKMNSHQDISEEIRQSTSHPPIEIKKDSEKPQDRYKIVTNTNITYYEPEINTDSFEPHDKSDEYTDIDLTAENERNSEIIKKQDIYSDDDEDDSQTTLEENFESGREFDNSSSEDKSKSSEVLTKNKHALIKTYSKVAEETDREHHQHNTHSQNKYNLLRNNKNTREKPHHRQLSHQVSRDFSSEYRHNNKKPKIIRDSSERGHHNLYVTKEISGEVKKTKNRPKLIVEHSGEHNHRNHIDNFKSIEKVIPSKVTKGYLTYFSDDNHRISHEENFHEKEYNNEHKSHSKHSYENNNHRINLNSKELKSNEEHDNEVKKYNNYNDYFKEDGYKSNTNSHESSEKHYSSVHHKMTSDHFSGDDHRMSGESSKQDVDNKHSKTSSNHNENDHRISLDDYTKSQINTHISSVGHLKKNSHRINPDDNNSYEEMPTNKHKSSSKYSNEMNKSYEREQDNKHKHNSMGSNEDAHQVIVDENISKKIHKDYKPKNYIRNDRSKEAYSYKLNIEDIPQSEKNDHRINESENHDEKNENQHKELEPYSSSYSKQKKDTSSSREDHDRSSPLPDSDFWHDSPQRNTFHKTNNEFSNKIGHTVLRDFNGHADDEIVSKINNMPFGDGRGDKKSETGKGGGEDYHDLEDYMASVNSREALRGKPQDETVKPSERQLAEGNEYDQPAAKPQESRKIFQKCLNKTASKLCRKSCISAYKNVCRRMRCTSKSKKALKKECKRSCKKVFSSKSSKYSDESGN